MAKNLAMHGVWGVTRYAFSSASSSPLFTLLLGVIYRLTGVHQLTSLILSWAFGGIALFQADRLAEQHLKPLWRCIALAAIIILAPLFVSGLLGMEHTLHLTLVLVFLRLFDRAEQHPKKLALISALMVGARYEGLFLVAVAVVLMVIRKVWQPVLWLIAGAALPVAIYGAYSVAHGAYFLPNSVALKGTEPGKHFLVDLGRHALGAPHLFLLLVSLYVAAFGLRRTQPALARAVLLIAGAGTLHLFCAGIGSCFRYEAYLVASGILASAIAFGYLRRGWQLAFCAALFPGLLMLDSRAVNATALPSYSRAIYLQQWQVAHFLRASFPQARVAANDIGAISFFTDIHCTDLVGLADSTIFTAKRSGRYTTETVRSETAANRVQIAMVYDSWFVGRHRHYLDGPPLPKEWVLVAQLTVPHSQVLGADAVSFYAVDLVMAAQLGAALRKFSLPEADHL